MALKIKKWYPDNNIVCAMANTSKECFESLEFMNECDIHFNLELNWVEAIINQEKNKGTHYKVTDFKSLKRNGEIFEDGIKKYGIPSVINKWCTRELKLVPLKKFADKTFGLNNYSIAIGIRADEMDRVRKDYKENNVFYPLLDKGITTRERNKFWSKQHIKLKIPAYKGNCDLCFEKSFRKLMTIIKDNPEKIKWWDEMSEKYSGIPICGKKNYNTYAKSVGMNFYRQNLSIKDLVKMSKKPFSKATNEYVYENDLFDFEEDCGNGCVVF